MADFVSPEYAATCDKCGVEWEQGDDWFPGETEFHVEQILGEAFKTPTLCKDCEYETINEMMSRLPKGPL